MTLGIYLETWMWILDEDNQRVPEQLLWGGVGGRAYFCYLCYRRMLLQKKKKTQNYAHISPLQKNNLTLQKLADLALG